MFVECLSNRVIPAQHALESTPAIKKLQRVFGAEHVEILTLRALALCQQKKILENRVLSDGLWAAAPMDELELSDAVVGLKIKLASGVSCAEGSLFNLLSDFEAMAPICIAWC